MIQIISEKWSTFPRKNRRIIVPNATTTLGDDRKRLIMFKGRFNELLSKSPEAKVTVYVIIMIKNIVPIDIVKS